METPVSVASWIVAVAAREDPNLDRRLGLRVVAIVRKRLDLEANLYQILQILSLTLFEKTPILQALQASDAQEELIDTGTQLIPFDY